MAPHNMNVLDKDVIGYLLAHVSDERVFVTCRAACGLFRQILDSPALRETRARCAAALVSRNTNRIKPLYKKGKLPAIQWIARVKLGVLMLSDAETAGLAYKRACTCRASGKLMEAQWLSDLTIGAGEALELSCTQGHLETARWLAKAHTLTAKDIQDKDYEPLLGACARGYFEVVKWLFTEFGLGADDVRYGENYSIRLASRNGHLEIAQWLVSEFNIKVEDIRAGANFTLGYLCDNQDLVGAKWLVSTFGLTADDALQAGVDSGRLWSKALIGDAEAKWLYKKFWGSEHLLACGLTK
jgi:ankyrin repeat protein